MIKETHFKWTAKVMFESPKGTTGSPIVGPKVSWNERASGREENMAAAREVCASRLEEKQTSM